MAVSFKPKWPDLNPVSFVYDARGRVQSISQGSGAETRTSAFGYNSLGYLETITDPLNRVTSFQYDDAGRVTQQTLPGNRVIGFNYDANGNLTSLTPPGKPQHAFDYTEVDLDEGVRPTNRSQRRHARHDLLPTTPNANPRSITRPDGQTIDFDYDTAGRLSTLEPAEPSVDLRLQRHHRQPHEHHRLDRQQPGLHLRRLTAQELDLERAGLWQRGLELRQQLPCHESDHQRSELHQLRLRQRQPAHQSRSLTLSRNPQNGLLTGTTLGNVTDSWTYNNFAEPTSYTASVSGTPVYSTTFTRDKLGRITSKSETIQGVTDNYSTAMT